MVRRQSCLTASRGAARWSAHCFREVRSMDPKIVGTQTPVRELNMQVNEDVLAEPGHLSWMSTAIQMQTSTTAGGQQGGFLGALGRAVAGGTLFMTEYTSIGGQGPLAFSATLPGQSPPPGHAPGDRATGPPPRLPCGHPP